MVCKLRGIGLCDGKMCVKAGKHACVPLFTWAKIKWTSTKTGGREVFLPEESFKTIIS